MIRRRLLIVIRQALARAIDQGAVDAAAVPDKVEVERTRDKRFGDFSTNIAMVLAREARAGGAKKLNPHEVAEAVAAVVEKGDLIRDIEIAGPGFINFHLQEAFLQGALNEIERQGLEFGRSAGGRGRRVQVEFVSANPTGPLHIGHGRWAAVGDTLANVLEATGHTVEREFYVNDYGTQMGLFGASVAARYAQIFGRDEPVPEHGYQGAYVEDIARVIAERDGDVHLVLSDEDRRLVMRREAERMILEHFKQVLDAYGVKFDVWFSETALHESGEITKAIGRLGERGLTFKQDGALWLKTTRYGDDKDRVLVRESGEPTYFAADIAYHLDKFERGFDTVIDVWGADHHGYVGRVKAAVQALGLAPGCLEIIIGQLVNLYRGGEPVRMSKRTGEMVTFEELMNEVGPDVARYLFLTRSTDSPLDFDIDLAKRQSQENPVYYVQYAHARISSILKFAESKGAPVPAPGEADLSVLKEDAELDLIRQLIGFPDFVEDCARLRAPFKLTRFAEDLAGLFHVFYTKHRVVTDDAMLTAARLTLVKCTQIVLKNALGLLGVSAPESM